MAFSKSDIAPALVNGSEVTLSDSEKDAIITEWNKNLVSELNLALLNLRSKRNKLLADSDWMANSDVTMTDAWKTYRQALRDLTNGLDTVDKVNSVIWPTEPS